MSLDYFCDVIIQTEDVQELNDKLEQLDLSLLETRNERGDSLLHLLVQAQCSVDVFAIVLKRSNISLRNEDFKLVQDLFAGKTWEKQYESVLVDYLADKLRNCEGDQIRYLIVQGWNYKPYLDNAIEKLMDELNDNFTSYLMSIENLVENIRRLTQLIVNGDSDSFILFKESMRLAPFQLNETISFRNQCGLTLHHVAVIFEKYDFVGFMVEQCLEHNIRLTDNMGRTGLHYLHSIKPTARRDELIFQMTTSIQFDFVDVLGNCPQYYECYPHLLNFGYYKEFVKSDLMSFKVKNLAKYENDSDYLKKTVGKALVAAFTLVVEKRPMDPIDFLGNFLKFYATNSDTSEYQYEILSARINMDLTEDRKRNFTFNPEIFSPFVKIARDKYGTPYGYKLLIKKLQSFSSMDVDWFEIVKRGVNFALRDSNENTLKEIASSMEYENIKDHLDSVILNMINEKNLQALQNLYCCGYYENFPDIYELCGPDLFDVSQEVADFYLRLPKEYENQLVVFDVEQSGSGRDWKSLIANEWNAYAYNKRGMSVVHFAIATNNEPLFNYLVEYFPDCLKLKDCFNRNVCHYCYAFQNKQLRAIVDQLYPEGREEMDCFDYLPEYYEFYQSAFRNLL